MKIEKLQKNLYAEGANTKIRIESSILTDKLKETQTKNEVSLGTLLEFSKISGDRFDDITRRIFAGLGIDWSNENAKIGFDMFCKMKCFMEHYTATDSELIKMWTKIINPQS